MGLIGWIKKEIESNSRQRRQSAPPPSLYNQNQNNVNQHRDEAYMKAISRFNEWRNNQRFEKLNETKNASAITNAVSLQESIITAADISISSLEIDDSEKQRLIEFRREQRRAKQNVRKLEQKVDIVMSQTSQSQHRYSLPILKETTDQKNRRKNSKKIHPSSTIDEIEEFETNHCKDMDDDFPMSVTSPPSKFYRQNSEPYSEGKKKITPKKLMGRNMLRRAKSHNKGKAPPPPIDSESSSGFRNGNFKRYEVISSSAYDEFVKQSAIYKANLSRAEDPDKINSVGETGSSGSSSSIAEKNAKKTRRMSPPYLTVINKHGEEVEYALPYSERESLMTIPPLPDTLPPDHARMNPNDFDRVINENFNFLKTHLDFSGHEDAKMRKPENEFDPIYTSFSDMPSRKVLKKIQITDLDRSNNTSLIKTPAQSGDIIKELDALSQWTSNLKNSVEKIGDNKFQVDDYLKMNQKYRVFRSQDLKIKSGVFRNSQTLPLEFAFGFFNKTPITTRSTIPDVYNDNGVSDIASKRDFEFLSQIHHHNIAIMMGINYDEDLRVMSLIMEPFEFTLNHYLHQMDHYFSIEQTISIVKQIAEAVQYIHESGFIHSNVNSHAILIRRFPFAVKLSSFELTTEILPRQSIEKIFRLKTIKEGEMSLMRLVPEETDLVEKYYKMSKHHFYNESTAKEFPVVDYAKESARLAYLIDFRRIFSTHFYQAPELLPAKNDFTYKFVLPTIRSDVFSLGLLLWEILNHCIPFVIYNYDELSTAYSKNEANLPLLDKSCISFMEIFNRCLHRNADERFSDVYQLIDMLNMADASSEGEKYPFKNITDKKYYEKTPQKVYFNAGEKDPQKRAENAITVENILNVKSTKSLSESVKSSEMEAHVVSISQQPEILNDNPVHRIRKSLENSAPKKPLRMREESPGFLEISKKSDLFQSFFDLNRLETPKIDKNGIYGERTSTLKKRCKIDAIGKKSVKGLFENNFDKMNSELEQITQNDFLDEIKQEMSERNREMSSFLNCGMQHNSMSIGDVSRSTDDIRQTLKSLKSPLKRSESDNIAGNESRLVDDSDCRLPKTPIARQNRIRRNVWLSDSKKPSGGKISDRENFKPNKTVGELSASSTKNYNVSIKIHRNDLDKDEDASASSPLTKINNADLNNSKYNVDINKKYYPMMPEMLSDVIRKRDKSMTNSMIENDNNKSFKAPIRSVRDAVKFIEATFTPKSYQSPKFKRTLQIESSPCPKIAHEETQTEKFFLPQLREKVAVDDEKHDDEARECMTKASQSIQKLSEIISTTSDSNNFPQIRQAQVTVNVQQITHRPSDIGQLKKLQEQSRHSICNSAELIKRWQMQIKTNSKSLCNVNKDDVVSASCSSLVARSNDQISPANQQQSGKCCKYFCRNCGFTMLPVELLQKMQQGNGRMSVASSLQSIKGNEDGSQAMATLRRCPKITETRSTEDIYIDDDFCQGISQSLGANMELLPPHDLFDSLNFNFFEFLQSQPHDWTLTEGETRVNNQLEWNGGGEEGDNEEKTQIEEEEHDDEEIKKIDEAEANKTEEI